MCQAGTITGGQRLLAHPMHDLPRGDTDGGVEPVPHTVNTCGARGLALKHRLHLSTLSLLKFTLATQSRAGLMGRRQERDSIT